MSDSGEEGPGAKRQGSTRNKSSPVSIDWEDEEEAVARDTVEDLVTNSSGKGSTLKERDTVQDSVDHSTGKGSTVTPRSTVQDSVTLSSGKSSTSKERDTVQDSVALSAGKSSTSKERDTVQDSVNYSSVKSSTSKERDTVQDSVTLSSGKSSTSKERDTVQNSVDNSSGKGSTSKERSTVQDSVGRSSGKSGTVRSTVQDSVDYFGGKGNAVTPRNTVQDSINYSPEVRSAVTPRNTAQDSINYSPRKGSILKVPEDEDVPVSEDSSPERQSLGDELPGPRTTIASNVESGTASDDSGAASRQPSQDEDIRSTSKSRRLEYFRSGADADCQVHVLSTCPASNDPVASVCYKKFGCHRIFLATASDKLEQDVYQNKQWNGVLQINGVSPESVEIFLEFIYTFEVTSPLVQLNLVGDIFILSCAYNMPELLRSFSEKLKQQEWPLDGIFPAFDLAFRHNLTDLERICMEKILEKGEILTRERSLMDLQIYTLNYVIQHWLVAELVSQDDLINILKRYQEINEITFANTQKFPHFTKIIKYFPTVLLDAEGFINQY
ncbi:uncharacterized protein LOC119550505 [Drosophila subpulchrella]|uniref:uncharacterized protein LOC119550505 n=1 Tax=Drosophila subpulchrella TaxID=1486046 RepID=UPI0018A13A17|nr:uncharacterized protein LOC119550505 [Drosophila subpulchrella]